MTTRLSNPTQTRDASEKQTGSNASARWQGRRANAASAFLTLMILSGCVAKDVVPTDVSGYVTDVGERVVKLDWNSAKPVDVVLSEYQFAPNSLHFHQGTPYRLRLRNAGIEVHDFASKPFFQAIAAAKLVDAEGTTPLPHLISIGVDPGTAKDLYFVPVRPGSYSFDCDEPLHATFGMTGTAEIE